VQDVIVRPSDHSVKELFTETGERTHVGMSKSILLTLDRVRELKKMIRSLLFNYLELLNLMIESPTAKLDEDTTLGIMSNQTETTNKPAWEIKANQIQLLLINMSYLLNSYRPHQAREQLITILQEQFNRRDKATTSINETITSCVTLLEEAKKVLSSTMETDKEHKKVEIEESNAKKRKREEDEPVEKAQKEEIEEQELPADVLTLFAQIRQEVGK
jgi:mediator of RNA polymerase II transcription subunit 7